MPSSVGGGSVALQILAITDFLNSIEPPTGHRERVIDHDGRPVSAGGITRLATCLAELRRGHQHSITVASGDLVSGSSLVNHIFHQEASVDLLGRLGLALSAVGSHELDRGSAELVRLQHGGDHPDRPAGTPRWQGAMFEWLSADIIERDSGRSLLAESTVRTFGGVDVGFVGLTIPHAAEFIGDPGGIAEVEFLDQVTAASDALWRLRKSGVGTVVVLMHAGDFNTPGARPNGAEIREERVGLEGGGIEIARALTGADLIIGGHTCAHYVIELSGSGRARRLYTNNAGHGREVTEVTLQLDPGTGAPVPGSLRAVNHVVVRDLPPDPGVAAAVATWTSRAERVAQAPAGTVSAAIPANQTVSGESPIGNLIADAQLAACRSDAGGAAGVVFVYPPIPGVPFIGAGLPYRPAANGAGAITAEDLYRVHPIDFPIWVVTLSGAALRRLLEEQWQIGPDGAERTIVLQPSGNLWYAVDPSAPLGVRVGEINLDGKPVDPDLDYRVAASFALFLLRFGFSELAGGSERRGSERPLVALTEFFRTHSPVAPPATDRVRLVGSEHRVGGM